MASTEAIVGSLQQLPSSRAIPTTHLIRSVKPNFKLRLQYLPAPQASMTRSKDDNGAGCPRKAYEENGHGNRGSVSSLLRAVQEGGSNAVMQQVSSIRHFFMPELPYAIITEIKKRVPLSFRGEEEEEQEQEGQGISEIITTVEKKVEEQLHVMGPRCAWPRLKLTNSVEEGRKDEMQMLNYTTPGPRCAWPRGRAEPQTLDTILGHGKQEETRIGCMSTTEEMVRVNSSIIGDRHGENLDNNYCKTMQTQNSDVVDGPRCSWPRSTTPRRMLATGVGLGLVNYLLIGQGAAPALAILLQSPLPINTGEENSASPVSPAH